MAVAGMAVGHEDFPLCMSYFRAFWMVQRWVVAGEIGAEDRDGAGGASMGTSAVRTAAQASDRTEGEHQVGGERVEERP